MWGSAAYGAQVAAYQQQQQAQQQKLAQAAAAAGAAGWQQAAGSAAAAWQQASAQGGQQQGAGDQGVGQSQSIVVSGCTHGTVGSIVRGSFTVSGENHGKPSYKKDAQVNGLDVMIYFWDERDGANFSGWWFGPKIGGDQVWAYHPSRSMQTPPQKGWKVPYDGPVDPTFIISAKGGAAQQAWGAATAAGQQQQQQQQWQQQGAQFAQMAQQMAAKKQQEDMMKKLQAQQMQRQQVEEQRQRMEAAKKQQEELRRKQEEERRKREQELLRKKEEQRATLAVRRVIQKARGMATPENIDEIKKELDEILVKEGANCGSQQQRMREEAEKGFEQAKVRVEQIKEQIKKEEERKVQAAKDRQAKAEEAAKLFDQLKELRQAADAAFAKLEEAAEPLTSAQETDDISLDEVTETAQAVEDAAVEARSKAKACTEFCLTKHAQIKVGIDMAEQDKLECFTDPFAKAREELESAKKRLNDWPRGTETAVKTAKTMKEKAVKKAAAKKEVAASEALFKKFSNKDGFLGKVEIKKYAKSEFDFTIPTEVLDKIFKTAVQEGEKGVSAALFRRLKVYVGIAREKVRDDQRRIDREAREKEVAKKKEVLQGKLDASAKEVTQAEESVTNTEKEAMQLPSKSKTMSSSEMVTLADRIEEILKTSKETVAATKAAVAKLVEDVDPDLLKWMTVEVKKLESRMGRFEPRLVRSTSLLVKFRDDARKKSEREMQEVERRALAIMKHHQKETSLSNEEMFKVFDTNKDGHIDADEFVHFFTFCKRPPIEKKEKSPPKADAEDGKKEDGAAAAVEEELLPAPAAEELRRLAERIDEDEDGFISKERFTTFMRIYMKVVKDTVITNGLSIKDSKTIRRLEMGEVVEVAEAAIKEGTVDVMRVHAISLKDGVEGWITVSGNQGTHFLEEGGNIFKVIKETILTECFELDASASKESARKLKDHTKKLKPGELVEVREWPKKEEKSGLMRMKCKVKSDSSIGWVTSVGNQGAVYLELV